MKILSPSCNLLKQVDNHCADNLNKNYFMNFEIKIDKKKVIDFLHIMSGHLGIKLQLPDIFSSTDDDA